MLSKPLQEIGLDDLKAMIGLARESKTLEFKRLIAPDKDGDATLVRGVSAMANTAGGDFIIGVSERDGSADAVDGIEPVGGVDLYKRSLQQKLASLIEPGLPSPDIHEVDCGSGRWVFIIRVGRSWIGPHRCLRDNKFYMRTSAATVSMDMSDLRVAFTARDSGMERIEAFRRDRLLQLEGVERQFQWLMGQSLFCTWRRCPRS